VITITTSAGTDSGPCDGAGVACPGAGVAGAGVAGAGVVGVGVSGPGPGVGVEFAGLSVGVGVGRNGPRQHPSVGHCSCLVSLALIGHSWGIGLTPGRQLTPPSLTHWLSGSFVGADVAFEVGADVFEVGADVFEPLRAVTQ
jgi:hypothetical protein